MSERRRETSTKHRGSPDHELGERRSHRNASLVVRSLYPECQEAIADEIGFEPDHQMAECPTRWSDRRPRSHLLRGEAENPLVPILGQEVEDQSNDQLLVGCVTFSDEQSQSDQGSVREPGLSVGSA